MLRALSASGVLAESAVPDVWASVRKREANGSTGIGRGVAVPHSKHAAVSKMAGAIALAPAGLDFASLDHLPVYSIVMLLSPEDQPQTHLLAMNLIFNNLQRDSFRRFLRTAGSVEKILELLDEADAGR
jgi:PTS system fructose-specific IIA component/PTS system nitrogen regulatory IIA component